MRQFVYCTASTVIRICRVKYEESRGMQRTLTGLSRHATERQNRRLSTNSARPFRHYNRNQGLIA